MPIAKNINIRQKESHTSHLALSDLKKGVKARVLDIIPPESDLVRLMAMGVCRGRIINIQKDSNPLIVKVYNSKIGISKELAKRIIVELC